MKTMRIHSMASYSQTLTFGGFRTHCGLPATQIAPYPGVTSIRSRTENSNCSRRHLLRGYASSRPPAEFWENIIYIALTASGFAAVAISFL